MYFTYDENCVLIIEKRIMFRKETYMALDLIVLNKMKIII